MWDDFWTGFQTTFFFILLLALALLLLGALVIGIFLVITQVPVIGYIGGALIGLSIIGGIVSAIIGKIETSRINKKFEKREAEEKASDAEKANDTTDHDPKWVALGKKAQEKWWKENG
jgi:hypothetical protein